MSNRVATVVGFEVAFGHVRRVLGAVNEYVIPREVFRWSRSCYFFIPLVGSPKSCIDIENDAPVVEFLMVDDLAYEKLCRLFHGTSIAEFDMRD